MGDTATMAVKASDVSIRIVEPGNVDWSKSPGIPVYASEQEGSSNQEKFFDASEESTKVTSEPAAPAAIKDAKLDYSEVVNGTDNQTYTRKPSAATQVLLRETTRRRTWYGSESDLLTIPRSPIRRSFKRRSYSDFEPEIVTDAEDCIKMLETGGDLMRVQNAIRSGTSLWMETFLDLSGFELLFETLQRLSNVHGDVGEHMQCVQCIQAVMNNSQGLQHIIARPEYSEKFAVVLSMKDELVKNELISLMASLALVDINGYRLVEKALFEHHIRNKTRYIYSQILDDLSSCTLTAYKISLLSFINVLIRGAPNYTERCHIRRDLLGQGLKPILASLRGSDVHEDILLQVNVYEETQHGDEDWPESYDLSSAGDLIERLCQQASSQPLEPKLVHILQHFLIMGFDDTNSYQMWDLLERFVEVLCYYKGEEFNAAANKAVQILRDSFTRELFLSTETQTDQQSQPYAVSRSTQTDRKVSHGRKQSISCNISSADPKVDSRQIGNKVESKENSPIRRDKKTIRGSKGLHAGTDTGIIDTNRKRLETRSPSDPQLLARSGFVRLTPLTSSMIGSVSAMSTANALATRAGGSFRLASSDKNNNVSRTRERSTSPAPIANSTPLSEIYVVSGRLVCPGCSQLVPPENGDINNVPQRASSRTSQSLGNTLAVECTNAPPPPPLPLDLAEVSAFIPPAPPLPPPIVQAVKPHVPSSGGAPSTPPPPPPPLPAALSATIPHISPKKSKAVDGHFTYPQSGRPKLRTINWQVLRSASDLSASVWSDPQAKSVDIDSNKRKRIEELFRERDLSRSTSISIRRTSEVQLLDHTRQLSVNVFLKHLRDPPWRQVIEDIDKDSATYMTTEKLKGLRSILPTKEEFDLVNAYSGDKAKLGIAEQFVLSLSDKKSLATWVDFMIMNDEVITSLQTCKENVELVKTACEELLRSRSLRKFLHFVLRMGNYLNEGSYAGSAPAFKISSLPKLCETKANKARVTLLHTIVELADNSLLTFVDAIGGCASAAKIDLKCLADEKRELQTRINDLNKRILLASDNRLISRSRMFFADSKTLTDEVTEALKHIDSLRRAVQDYFADDSKLEDILLTFETFASQVKTALRENKERKAIEEKVTRRRKETARLKGFDRQDNNNNVIENLLNEIRKGDVKLRSVNAPTKDEVIRARRRNSVSQSDQQLKLAIHDAQPTKV